LDYLRVAQHSAADVAVCLIIKKVMSAIVFYNLFYRDYGTMQVSGIVGMKDLMILMVIELFYVFMVKHD